MATECDVNKSRRFDRGMSRRTRKATSLVACYEDRYMPPLARQLLQEARLKRLFQCEDPELQAPQQCEDADQLMEIPQAPQEHEDFDKVPEFYQDEQEKKPLQYEDEEQEKKPQLHQDEEQNIPKQYQDEEETPQQYEDEEQDKRPEQHQDEEQNIPKQYQDEEEEKTGQQREDDDAPEQCLEEDQKTPEQYQDKEEEDEQNISEQYQGQVQRTEQQYQDEQDSEQCQDGEQKTPEKHQDEEEKTVKQCQDEDEKTSEKYKDKDEQKAQQGRQATEQKTLVQHLEMPFTPMPVDNMPRLSLLELIREKQLGTGEGKGTSNFSYSENAFANRRAPVAAAGGPTLAMVIRRHDGGKKPTGIIRRCVKALNQMIKTKHGSKKNTPFKEV